MYIKLTLEELLFIDDSLTLNMGHCPGLISSQLLDRSPNSIIAAPETLINKVIDGIAFICSEKKEDKEVVLDLEKFELMILREVVKISSQDVLSGEEMLHLKIKIISCLHEISEHYTKIQDARNYFMEEEVRNEKSKWFNTWFIFNF